MAADDEREDAGEEILTNPGSRLAALRQAIRRSSDAAMRAVKAAERIAEKAESIPPSEPEGEPT